MSIYTELTTGRVLWGPGQPHPLGVLADELAQMREQLPAQLAHMKEAAEHTHERLSALLGGMNDTADPTALFTSTDQAAKTIIINRFHNRKHLEHLLLIFQLQRARRTLGRLQAIQAARDLVNGLLQEEEAFSSPVVERRSVFLPPLERGALSAHPRDSGTLLLQVA